MRSLADSLRSLASGTRSGCSAGAEAQFAALGAARRTHIAAVARRASNPIILPAAARTGGDPLAGRHLDVAAALRSGANCSTNRPPQPAMCGLMPGQRVGDLMENHIADCGFIV